MEFLKTIFEGKTAVINIDRPKANALSASLLQDLNALLDELEQNDDVRVIVIRGEGRFFSAGADIKEFTSIPSGKEFAKLASAGQAIFERIEQFPKPVIASIHGAALGGGLELALSCHFRLVSENSKLGLPELQLGLIPGYAGTQRLTKYIGSGRALEMLFTSEPISGIEAVQLGLANHAFPEESLYEETLKIARKIEKKSPASLKAVIQLVNYAKTARFYEGVDKEAELFGEVFDTNDAKEGIQAFLEKREPVFKGE